MPYFPPRRETKYYCPNCKAWFIPSNISCTVLHEPGTCCHKYEEKIELTKEEIYQNMLENESLF